MKLAHSTEGDKIARKTVTKAKKSYYQTKIAYITSPKEAFAIAGWHKLTGRYNTIM